MNHFAQKKVSCLITSKAHSESGNGTIFMLVALLPLLFLGASLAGDSVLVSREVRGVQEAVDEAALNAVARLAAYPQAAAFTLLPDEQPALMKAMRRAAYSVLVRNVALQKSIETLGERRAFEVSRSGNRVTVRARVESPLHFSHLLSSLLERSSEETAMMSFIGTATTHYPRTIIGIDVTTRVEGRSHGTYPTLLQNEARMRFPSVSTMVQRVVQQKLFSMCQGASLVLKKQAVLALLRSLRWAGDESHSLVTLPSWKNRLENAEMVELGGAMQASLIGSEEEPVSYADGVRVSPLVRDATLCLRMLMYPYCTSLSTLHTFDSAYLKSSGRVLPDERVFLYPQEFSDQLPTPQHLVWALPGTPDHRFASTIERWDALLAKVRNSNSSKPILLVLITESTEPFHGAIRTAYLQMLRRARLLSSKIHLHQVTVKSDHHAEVTSWQEWGNSLSNRTESFPQLTFAQVSNVREAQEWALRLLREVRIQKVVA